MLLTMTDGQFARRVAAALLVPLGPALVQPIERIILSRAEWPLEKSLGIFFGTLVASYAYFALIGSLALAMRLALKAPARAGVVVGLFATAGSSVLLIAVGASGAFSEGPLWTGVPATALFGAAMTLPLSVAYCFIAGVPWRTVKIAAT